jgi:hypothetical protein
VKNPLSREHRPDEEALSALFDGQLEASRVAALEAHVAACAACTLRLEELRATRALLAAMPEPALPRSFRLRQADVEQPRRSSGTPGWARWSPALAAAAVVVFVSVLAFDLQSSDNTDSAGGFARTFGEAQLGYSGEDSAGSAVPPSGVTTTDDEAARDGATSPSANFNVNSGVPTPCPACAVAPSPGVDPERITPADNGAIAESAPGSGPPAPAPSAPLTAPTPPSAPAGAIAEADSDAAEPASPVTVQDSAASADASATEIAEMQKARLEAIADDDDDDAGDAALLAVEVVAAVTAVAAGGATLWWWRRRRSTQV